MRILTYMGALAVVFAAAYGAGGVTGSPVERAADELSTDAAPDAPAHDAAPGGLQVSSSGFTLSPISAPASAGAPGQLSFSIIGPGGRPVTDFTEAHEKDLHLIVVRTDGTQYRHVHPVLQTDGTWTVDWQWATGGTYKLFADFVPAASDDGLTLTRTVEVAGEVAASSSPVDSASAEVDGYTVSLTGDLQPGRSSPLTVTVERDGRPVTNLEPYLGAYGHLVALRDGDLAYLHVHPEGEPGDAGTESGPDVDFAVQTPTAGTYRLYFDFQIDGTVRTAEFTVTATGPADEAPDAGGHDGDGGGHG